jgi:lysophospholipase L1-like esterase
MMTTMDKKHKTRIAIIATPWILFGISAIALVRDSVFFRILSSSQWGASSALLITLYSVVFVLGYLFASVSLFAVIVSRPRYEMLVAYLKKRWVLVAAVTYILILHIVAILLQYTVAILLLLWTLGLFASLLLLAKSEKQLAEWTKRILIVFLALVITAYSIEGLLILSHADLGFNGHILGYEYTWGHKVVNNSLGFREKEFVTPKPPNVYRIMVLGDSYTWGTGLAEEERYSNRLEALLSSKFPYKEIEVLNFGIGGLATVHEREVLAQYQDMVKPDLIIVGMCQNDTQPREGGGYYSVEMERYMIPFLVIRRLKLLGFNDVSDVLYLGFTTLLTKLGKIPDWNVALQRTYEKESAEWKQFEKALRDIKTMSDDMGLTSPVFAVLNEGTSITKPTDYNNPDEALKIQLGWYHQAEEAARKIGFITVNFEDEFGKELSNEIMAVNRKDRHPSSKMNEIYARKLFQVITPIIESDIKHRSRNQEGTKIENSLVRGSVSIAEDCHIKDSFIGPFTSIGSGTVIENSSMEHLVILEGCRIVKVERLADSLIGKDSVVSKQEGNFKPKRLFVGDDSNIEL